VPVNLEKWCPGPTSYDFAGKSGSPNVIITDMWRDDVDPFTCLAAFAVFSKIQTKAKLHVYGLPRDRRGIAVYLRSIQDRGQLGVAQGWAKGLENVYRAADLLISPHRIYTRALREAMACGCQVISGKNAHSDHLEAFVKAMSRRLLNPHDTRKEAEHLFNPKKTAKQFLEVVNHIYA
jgi:glycosyltransferase involved in cell wall biosynthesis